MKSFTKTTNQSEDEMMFNQDRTIAERTVLTIAAVFGSILLFFGVQIIVSVIVVLVLSAFGNNEASVNDLISSNNAVQFAFSLIVAAFLISAIFIFLKMVKRKPWRFLKLNKRPRFKQFMEVLLIYGLYFLTLIIASAIVSNATSVDVSQEQDLGAIATEGWGLLLTFLSLVVLAPIVEEIFFRGFLYRITKSLAGRVVGYIIVSLLFGAAHLEFENLNYIAAIDTLIFSVFLIYVYERHNSLYSSIFLHATKNAIAFTALFLAPLYLQTMMG